MSRERFTFYIPGTRPREEVDATEFELPFGPYTSTRDRETYQKLLDAAEQGTSLIPTRGGQQYRVKVDWDEVE